MEMSLARLAESIGARLIGDADRSVRGVAGLDFASLDQITFVADPKYVSRLGASKAAAAIVRDYVQGIQMTQLVVDDVDRALVEALSLFAKQYEVCAEGVDPTARIGNDVSLGSGVGIGPHVVIGDGAIIGDGTFIAAGCTVGPKTRIGAACRLYPGVAVYDDCRIGSHVVIQANSVIGSIGFGYTSVEGAPRLVPHVGNVEIGDFVEIGANTCVDRAKFGSTRIGAGTKIDNLVQVAHNVQIGRCCLIAGMSGIAGSCRLGDGVVLGGQVGVRDHVSIGDGAMVGGKSFVMKDIAPGEKVFGYPALEKGKSLRIMHAAQRLPEMVSRLGKLEQGVRQQAVVSKQKELPRIRAIRWAAAAFAAGLVLPLLASISVHGLRLWLDPEEVRVERMVAKYQDGDDMFFVMADPHFEDLRTHDRLFLMGDLDQMIEGVIAYYGNDNDCYFLIPLSSVEGLKTGNLRDQLFMVKHMAIRNRTYALVTTEADRQFARL